MSKRFFINNLDTEFGKALLEELVKQPTEDPVHLGTTHSVIDAKPNGIKKILKREKPKLYRKKIIQQCDVYVYHLNQTEISDIEFGIQTMLKPIEDNKVFILVSDIMAWSSNTRKVKKEQKKVEEGGEEQAGQAEAVQKKQQQQQAAKEQGEKEEHQDEPKQQQQIGEEEHKQQVPIQYTSFQDTDYKERQPLEKYQYIKQIEEKVLSIQKENIKVFIICPGMIYGCGEDNLYPLFKAAWLQNPASLPFLNQGNNLVPMIHLKDLAKFVVKVAQSPPQYSPYLIAIDSNPNKTQKQIVQSISIGIGSGKIQSVQKSELFENPDLFLINVDIQPSKCLIGTADQPVQFQWTAKDGLGKNISSISNQFCKKHQLRPIKLLFIQNEQNWRKNSKIDLIEKKFSQYYRVPVLTVKQILASAKEKGDQQLKQDLNEQWANINSYLLKNEPTKLDQTMKVFYRAIRWRLNQNDCSNRGYILENFPQFNEELQHIFLKLSNKKLKRKRKPIPKQKIAQTKLKNEQGKQANQNQNEEQNVSQKKIEQGGQKQEEPQQPEPQQEEEQQQQQGENQGPKYELSFPESIISIKQAGKQSATEVINFFTTRGIDELIYDTTGAKQSEIFESLRNYIERNGRPNNYLVSEQQLLKNHFSFVHKQNEASIQERQKKQSLKAKQIKEIFDKRNKLRDEIIQIVNTEGQQQIKKMPFRNYLMEFVVPTLNEGLLQVSNIIPNDPVDLLAEYLYQKSYDF